MTADAFMAGYHEPLDKAKDYHFMIGKIFEELEQVQKNRWLRVRPVASGNGAQSTLHTCRAPNHNGHKGS